MRYTIEYLPANAELELGGVETLKRANATVYIQPRVACGCFGISRQSISFETASAAAKL